MLLANIIVVGAYCVGSVHNMLSACVINRNGYTCKWPRYQVSVYMCKQGTQYAIC